MSIFSDRLKIARDAAGLSQHDFGCKIGVSQQSIYRWEKEIASPDPATIFQICKVLGVSSDWILGLSDNSEVNYKAGIDGLLAGKKEKLPDNEQLKYFDADGIEIEADANLNRLIKLHVDAALKERMEAILRGNQHVNDCKKD